MMIMMTRTMILQLILLTFIVTTTCAQTVPIVCPIAGAADVSATIDTFDPVQRFSQLSGLALSSTQVSNVGNPILFGFNDISGEARLGIWDSITGERLMTLNIPEPNNDWEAMAYGTCGTFEGNCLYIADTGDNLARTSQGVESQRTMPYRILKIQEPDWNVVLDESTLLDSTIEVLEFDYSDPSSPTSIADSEAIFMDHTGWGEGSSIGDLYVVTKWDNLFTDTNNRVFYIPVSAWENLDTIYSPAALGNGDIVMGYRWTRADMTMNGQYIALGEVNSTSIYVRCPGLSVEESFLTHPIPCSEWINPVEGQTETIVWSEDGTRTLQISEGTRVPMQWITMVFDEANIVLCPDTGIAVNVTSLTPQSTPLPTTNETETAFPSSSLPEFTLTPNASDIPTASPSGTLTNASSVTPSFSDIPSLTLAPSPSLAPISTLSPSPEPPVVITQSPIASGMIITASPQIPTSGSMHTLSTTTLLLVLTVLTVASFSCQS